MSDSDQLDCMANSKQIQRARLLLRTLSWLSSELAAEIALRMFTTPQRVPRPGWETVILEKGNGGGPAERITIGGDLRAASFGLRSAPAIVLVHGWEGRGSQLAMLVEPLVTQGYRVVALDGPAHGDSPGRRVNVAQFAQKIQLVCEDLRADGSRVAGVVAHSFGAGATVLALARGAAIEKVVLVASPSSLVRVVEGFLEFMQLSEKVRQAFRRRLSKWTGLQPEQTDLAGIGRQLSVPTLIVHDPEEKVVSFHNAEQFIQHWPSASLVKLHKVGHTKILKSPLFISAVCEFFTGAAASEIATAQVQAPITQR